MSTLTTVLVSVISSVSLSGLTAVCVSLITPPSEARKERLMDRYRANREIERQLRIISKNAGALSNEVSSDMSDAARSHLTTIAQQHRQGVVAASEKIEDAMVDASLNADVRRVVSFIGGGLVRGIALSDRPSAKVGEEVGLYAGACLDLYTMSRWSIKRRRGFRNLVKAIKSDSSASAV
jgi:hypothetical protein